jgi:hypothetical protein
LKQDLESLIKLVEAVKLVNYGEELADAGGEGRIPDGRVWAEDTGLQPVDVQARSDEVTGSALLRFASRTSDGLYVVDAERTR